MLKHLVLGIGYEEKEYKDVYKAWLEHDVDIILARSVDEAVQKLLAFDIVCVIICSYTQDYTLYIIVDKDLYFCLEYRTVKVQNIEVELTPLEFEALHLLLRNKKRVLTF